MINATLTPEIVGKEIVSQQLITQVFNGSHPYLNTPRFKKLYIDFISGKKLTEIQRTNVVIFLTSIAELTSLIQQRTKAAGNYTQYELDIINALKERVRKNRLALNNVNTLNHTTEYKESIDKFVDNIEVDIDDSVVEQNKKEEVNDMIPEEEIMAPAEEKAPVLNTEETLVEETVIDTQEDTKEDTEETMDNITPINTPISTDEGVKQAHQVSGFKAFSLRTKEYINTVEERIPKIRENLEEQEELIKILENSIGLDYPEGQKESRERHDKILQKDIELRVPVLVKASTALVKMAEVVDIYKNTELMNWVEENFDKIIKLDRLLNGPLSLEDNIQQEERLTKEFITIFKEKHNIK